MTQKQTESIVVDVPEESSTKPLEPVKRKRGRPRVHPPKDANAPRRPVGRPRKFKMNL